MIAHAKRRLWIPVAALAVIVGVIFVASRKNGHQQPKFPRLPEFDSAEVWRSSSGGGETVAQVDPKDFSRLRSDFEGSPLDPKPMKWVFTGELRLFSGGEQVLKIDLFSHEGVVPFKIGRDYYLPKPGEGPPDHLDVSYLNPN